MFFFYFFSERKNFRRNAEISLSMYQVTPTDQLCDLFAPENTPEVTIGGNIRGISQFLIESSNSVEKLIKIAESNRSKSELEITLVLPKFRFFRKFRF